MGKIRGGMLWSGNIFHCHCVVMTDDQQCLILREMTTECQELDFTAHCDRQLDSFNCCIYDISVDAFSRHQ